MLSRKKNSYENKISGLTRKEKISMYLDFVNNFVTASKFGEHYNISTKDAIKVIDSGRKYHEEDLAKAKKKLSVKTSIGRPKAKKK